LQVGPSLVDGYRLPPSNSTQVTYGCGVGQLLCFRCTQAIIADTVIAYITHDNNPSSVKPAWCEATRQLVIIFLFYFILFYYFIIVIEIVHKVHK